MIKSFDSFSFAYFLISFAESLLRYYLYPTIVGLYAKNMAAEVDIKVDAGFHENTRSNQAGGAASLLAWIALLLRHRPSPASLEK